MNFSEPLSFLQRLTEDFEYSDCLDNAAQCSDRFEQLAYVAAFAVSSYANTTVRTGKPFNPLLGETYECDRFNDLGWRAFTEQVSQWPHALSVCLSLCCVVLIMAGINGLTNVQCIEEFAAIKKLMLIKFLAQGQNTQTSGTAI